MWTLLNRTQRVNYGLILLVAFMYFSSGSMMLYLQRFFMAIDADEKTSGILVAFAVIPFVLFSMVSGHLAGKFGARRLVVFGCLLHSVTALLYLQVESITPVVYLFRLMQGLGHVCVFTPLFVEVGKIIPDRFKARGIGYFAVAIQFGTASGSAVGDYVIKNHDWKTYFITIAVITFVCACVCQFIKGESGSGKEKQVKDSGNSYVANMNLVYGGLIMIFVLGAVFGTILQFVPTYFDKLLDTGIIEKEISCKLFLTSGLFTVAMIRIIGGGITDGRHRDRVVIFCHIGLMLTLFLITLIRSGGFSLFVSVIFGLSYGLLYPTTNAMVLTNSKESVRGRVSGLLTMLFEAGFRGFALIAGAVVGAAGYFSMFYFLLAFYVVGVLLFMFLQYKGRFFLRGSYEN